MKSYITLYRNIKLIILNITLIFSLEINLYLIHNNVHGILIMLKYDVILKFRY